MKEFLTFEVIEKFTMGHKAINMMDAFTTTIKYYIPSVENFTYWAHGPMIGMGACTHYEHFSGNVI
jgi:hypothetical protein